MELDVLVTEGLGDSSYVLTWGDEAAVVDPQRDVERFVDAARSRGATIRHVVETHVHNDYLSGALELRAATDAEIWGPAKAGYAFGYRPVEDGTEIPMGDATLLGVATPGHTLEHLAYAPARRSGTDRAVLGRQPHGRRRRPDRPARRRTHRRAHAPPVPFDATARRPGRCRPGAPHPRGRQLLRRRIARRAADLDDRRGADGQPRVHGDRRGGLRAAPAERADGVPRLLRGDGADQPGRAAGARFADSSSDHDRRRGGGRARRWSPAGRCSRRCGVRRATRRRVPERPARAVVRFVRGVARAVRDAAGAVGPGRRSARGGIPATATHRVGRGPRSPRRRRRRRGPRRAGRRARSPPCGSNSSSTSSARGRRARSSTFDRARSGTRATSRVRRTCSSATCPNASTGSTVRSGRR